MSGDNSSNKRPRNPYFYSNSMEKASWYTQFFVRSFFMRNSDNPYTGNAYKIQGCCFFIDKPILHISWFWIENRTSRGLVQNMHAHIYRKLYISEDEHYFRNNFSVMYILWVLGESKDFGIKDVAKRQSWTDL
jgi:hypothetical protein